MMNFPGHHGLRVVAFALVAFAATAFASVARGGSFDPRTGIEARAFARAHAEALGSKAEAEYALAQRRLARVAPRGKALINSVLVTHTAANITFDTSAGTIDLAAELELEAREDDVEEIELIVDQLETMTVKDESDNDLDWIWDAPSQVLIVTPPTAMNQGDTLTIRFTNEGEPDCSPDDFFGMEFCRVGEDIVYFTGVDFLPVAAPYSYDDLYAGGPTDFDIVTPPDWKVATTSDPTGVDEGVSEWTHHFEGHFSNTYGGFAAAPFETFAATAGDDVPVTAFVHSGTTDYGDDWAAIGADIIDTFSELFSPYLYNKHDIIQTRDELGGGVGPQSATFYYASALNTPPDQFSAESIYSHEIGHQWWGNMVRLGDPYSPWLNEGFAEYSSRLYGYEVWPAYYQDYLYDFYFLAFLFYVGPQNEVPMTGEELFAGDSLAYQAATYWKGAHVLRMLEWWLGRDAFHAALKTWAETYRSDASNESVDLDKFRAVLEAETGEDLELFFYQWVEHKGFPVYRWSSEFSGKTVEVRVEQVQSGDVFDLPIPVTIWVEDEDEPRTEVMEFNDDGVARETFSYDSNVRGVRADGDARIWGDKVPALTGDVNSDNIVDGIDLIYWAWSSGGAITGGDDAWNYINECDFDRDGDVDADDIDASLANFGEEGRIDG